MTPPEGSAVLAIPAIVAAAALLLLLASRLSRAGALARALRPHVGRAVRVELWGEPHAVGGSTELTLVSVRALGVGLHLELRGAGRSGSLKVAQPGEARLGAELVEIGTARYLQWARARVPDAAAPGAPAVRLTFRASQAG